MKELGKQLGGSLTPSIHQPVQFTDATSKACLVLPEKTPGWKIVPDRKLEVQTVKMVAY